jgi:hypothetical protein
MQSSEDKESPIVDFKKAVKFCTQFCHAPKEECETCRLLMKFPELEKYVKLKWKQQKEKSEWIEEWLTHVFHQQ